MASILLVLGISLAWISSSFPDLSSTKLNTGTGEMSLLGASSLSRTGISPTVGEEGEDEEDEKNDSPVSWLSVKLMKIQRTNLTSLEPR